MASKEQLQLVAHNCSQYDSKSGNSFTSAVETQISCETCKHFTKNHKCDIHLVDPILSRINNDEC
ncbi:hypothetical protein [Inediibacterium massiliense]|uniref:hypothetical protein n=1 Tax=Inediibacterium massiliense TaxID=1658111 RepID=UPI0006B68609|nr:hypothetical protein [Inediibacterium massiliense]